MAFGGCRSGAKGGRVGIISNGKGEQFATVKASTPHGGGRRHGGIPPTRRWWGGWWDFVSNGKGERSANLLFAVAKIERYNLG